MDRVQREGREFEEAADEFSRRHHVKRVCVGPNGRGCPNHIVDPLILDVAHIGGGGTKERKALKVFNRKHGGPVPNEQPGGRVYLQMLLWAEDHGYEPEARLGWQCPNCNQRERRAKIIAARRAVREGRSKVVTTLSEPHRALSEPSPPT